MNVPIEETVITYLSGVLTVPVQAEESPDGMPERFVLVELIGDSTENHLHHPTIALQTFGPSRLAAAELCEAVKEAMEGITADVDRVTACRMNAAYNFTDDRQKRHRYQAVFDLTTY